MRDFLYAAVPVFVGISRNVYWYIFRIAMYVFQHFFQGIKRYTTYLDVDNFIRWIAISRLRITEMTQVDKFYSLNKSYLLFEQPRPALNNTCSLFVVFDRM